MKKQNECKLTVEVAICSPLPPNQWTGLAQIALRLAVENTLGYRRAYNLARDMAALHGLAVYRGGHHIAIHAAGKMTGNRLAILTGTGPEWE